MQSVKINVSLEKSEDIILIRYISTKVKTKMKYSLEKILLLKFLKLIKLII